MEGLLAILVGAFAVAVSPLVPVMRPAAKAAVKGGLALAGVATGAAAGAAAVATGAAAAANHQWEQLRTHATAEKTTEHGAEMTEAADSKSMAVETAGEPVGGEAVADSTMTLAAESKGDAAVSADDAAPAAVEDAEAAPSETTADDAPAAKMNSAPTAGVEAGSELLVIDGIGPKAATILAAAGITTLAELAAADVDHLRTVLAAAGTRYRSLNPSSWPEQAIDVQKKAKRVAPKS